jgi:transcriptional regulator with XRE-family HTH domain
VEKKPSEQLWVEFGAWIRDERESRRLSQGGAASRAGIDRQQWYRIESGKSGTRRDTVIAIAHALSVDEDEALKKAGFDSPTREESGFNIEVANGVRVSMLDAKDYSEEDRKKFEIAFKSAHDTAKRMIDEEKEEEK